MEKDLSIKERIRGHNLIFNRKIFKRRRINEFAVFVAERHKFFVNRLIPSWNVLPTNVIYFSSLNGFKAALDKFSKNGHLSM